MPHDVHTTRGQLPSRLTPWVGREGALETAERAILTSHGGGGVVAITGPGGVGKSAIANELSWRLADRFPDARLWFSLAPRTTRRTTLNELLDAIIPAVAPKHRADDLDLEAKVVLFRRVLRDRRALVVLDDVEDEGQVEELVVGGSRSALVLVARTPLTRLQVPHIQLGPLSEEEGIKLLRTLGGDVPALQDDRVCAEVVRASEGLPLALQLVAAQLARPDVSARDVLYSLRSSTRWRIGHSDLNFTPYQSTLDAAYKRLSPQAAALLRLLGLLGRERVTVAGLVHDADLAAPLVRAALEELATNALVQADEGSYQIHPILRRFASERLGDRAAGTGEARIALGQLQDPDLAMLRERSSSGGATRELVDRVTIQEHGLRVAQDTGDWQREAQALSNLATLHFNEGHLDDASAALMAGLVAAERARDPGLLSLLQLSLGHVRRAQGNLTEAQELYADIARTSDRPDARTHALMALGDTLVEQHRVEDAGRMYQVALQNVSGDDASSRAHILVRLARLAETAEEFDRAIDLYHGALEYAEEQGVETARAMTAVRLGSLLALRGERDRAQTFLESGFRGYLRANLELAAAEAALAIGSASIAGDDLSVAADWFRRAADIAGTRSDRTVAIALYGQALVAFHAGEATAGALFESCLGHFRLAGEQFGEAHALRALADVLHASGDETEAKAARATSEALLTASGTEPVAPLDALSRMTL